MAALSRAPLVGLTGGIGAGKTTVARMFAERGAFVVEADDVGREVVAPGSRGLELLVAEFGAQILSPDGTLDRQRLASIAFADECRRARLEAITHPLIQARTRELLDAAPEGAVRIHDVPLLVELSLADKYDCVVVVDCPDEIRLARLLERGMTQADAQARIAAQASRSERLAVADIVIDNSGGRGELEAAVDSAWQSLLAAAGPQDG